MPTIQSSSYSEYPETKCRLFDNTLHTGAQTVFTMYLETLIKEVWARFPINQMFMTHFITLSSR